MRRTFKIMLIAGVIAASGGVIYMAGEALWDKDNAVGPPASAPPPPSVPVAKALSRTLAPTAEFTGFSGRAGDRGAAFAPWEEPLTPSSVPEGRLVSRGQLLFQIDPRPFEVALDTAVAQLRQAEVLARQAQADFDRIQRLVASGAVSRKNADDVTATRNARQAQMQSAKAAVAAARLELSWTRITAPIAGRVDRILVTRGNLVSGGVAGNATLLTTIVSHNPHVCVFRY
ncbi:transporter [Salmonella enterica subsp. enterica]|nr:transporter [Salmonella enterica subsp. enterica]